MPERPPTLCTSKALFDYRTLREYLHNYSALKQPLYHHLYEETDDYAPPSRPTSQCAAQP